MSKSYNTTAFQTSLHGFAYLCSEPGIIRKLLWVLVVLTAWAFAMYFLVTAIGEYMQSTTVTSIDTTTASLKDIYFPGIVLCNVNQVSKAFLRSINVESDEDSKVLFSEFLDGNPRLWENYTKTGIRDASYDENERKLEPVREELEKIYNWNSTESFIKLANQVSTHLAM